MYGTPCYDGVTYRAMGYQPEDWVFKGKLCNPVSMAPDTCNDQSLPVCLAHVHAEDCTFCSIIVTPQFPALIKSSTKQDVLE